MEKKSYNAGMGVQIQSWCLQMERNLSWAANIPLLGNVAAVMKIALANLQMGVGVLFALLSAPFALCNKEAKVFFSSSFSHVIHGGANILAGLSELISGWASTLYRRNYGHAENESQFDKLVVYKCLLDATLSSTLRTHFCIAI